AGCARSVNCTGLSDSDLQTARSLAFRATEARVDGGSRALSLMLSPVRELDPIFRATIDPVCMMHRAVWDSWLPVSILTSVMRWTSAHVTTWAQVREPISAAFLSRLRVGRATASIATWTNSANGAVYKPVDFSPWYTKQVVRKAALRRQFQKVADEMPHLVLKRQADHPNIITLVERLLVVRPKVPWQAPQNELMSAVRWLLGNGEVPFHSVEHFTDGSAFDLDADFGMAGCAVVQFPLGPGWFDPSPKCALRALGSPLMGLHQSIDGADLLAILILVRHSLAPITVRVDASY
ncbi:unnamed protein product, partial [Prorocentrum cordatum]